MAILDYVERGNHKQSVARTYRQDEPRRQDAHAKLSILDIVHKPLQRLERVKGTVSPKCFKKSTQKTQRLQVLGDKRNQQKPLSFIKKFPAVVILCVYLYFYVSNFLAIYYRSRKNQTSVTIHQIIFNFIEVAMEGCSTKIGSAKGCSSKDVLQ